MKILCAVAIVLLLGSSSFAAEWQEYFQSENGSKSYIDKSSILHLPKGKVRAWEKYQSLIGSGNLQLTVVDCTQKKYTILAMKPLIPDDNRSQKALDSVLKTWTKPTQYWNYIDTSQSQEAMYKTWCGKQVLK